MRIITDRPPASMRSKLFEVQSLLDAVVEGTTDAVWAVERNGALVLCNAAAATLLGRSADDVIGRTLEDVFPPRLAAHLRGVTGEVLAAGVPATSEEELVNEGAPAVTLLALHVPYRDSNGDVHGVVCVARDISKRRRNEDALRKYIDAIVRGHDDERRKIARELHDEAGQALTSMLVRLRALERDPRLTDDVLRGRLAEVVHVGEGLHGELSRLARGLHPGVLENLGLEAALANLAAQTRRGGLTVEADVKAGRRLPLPI